jgi:hypothetical protein
MTRMLRSSAVSLALGYIVLGLVSLVLFAAPLWYAWQGTIRDGRNEILQADAQRLTDIYRRDGYEALKNFIDARIRMQIAGDRILLLTDSARRPLAGNLPAWPNVPTTPGDYYVQVDMGVRGPQTALVHVALLGQVQLAGRPGQSFVRAAGETLLVRLDGRGGGIVHRGSVDRAHYPPGFDDSRRQPAPDHIRHHSWRPHASPAHALERR